MAGSSLSLVQDYYSPQLGNGSNVQTGIKRDVEVWDASGQCGFTFFLVSGLQIIVTLITSRTLSNIQHVPFIRKSSPFMFSSNTKTEERNKLSVGIFLRFSEDFLGLGWRWNHWTRSYLLQREAPNGILCQRAYISLQDKSDLLIWINLIKPVNKWSPDHMTWNTDLMQWKTNDNTEE